MFKLSEQRFINWKIAIMAVVFMLAFKGTSIAAPITWTGGNDNWNDTSNWSPSVLPDSSSDVGIDGGNVGNSAVTLDINSVIDNLTIDSGDSLNFNTNTSLSIGQNVSNAGAITLNSLGHPTNLIFNSGGSARTATLSGGGTITMSNNAQNSILDSGVGGVTLNTDNTIEGAGQILLDINNTGTIDANAAGTLTVDADNTSTNTGTMQASSGGTLKLNTGNYTNTGGTIQALNGSLVELSGASITDGILHTAGTGVIRNTSSATLEGVTLNSSFEQNNNTTTNLKSSFTNNGSYTMNSVGSLTDLVMTGASDVTLGGTGTVTMSNNAQNRIYGAAGERLIHGANHTIEGAGQIGVNQMKLTNQGLIDANQSLTLTIDPTDGAGNAANSGTMRASSGGTLILNGGTFDNTGGLVRSDNSTVKVQSSTVTGGNADVVGAGELQLNSGTITGGTITNSATGVIRTIGGSSQIGGTVNNVAGGQIIMDSNTVLRMEGGGSYTNDGTFKMESVGHPTDLIMTGGSDVTLGGTGSLSIGSSAQNRVYADASERLVNASTHTIEGGGQLGVNLMALTNHGTVDANLNGVTMTVDPNASGAINTGTMQASNGGTLTLKTADYTNTGGTIQALDGSLVELSGASITDGILHTAGTGVIRNVNSATLEDVTLNSLFEQNTNTTTSLKNSFTNNGSYTMNSIGHYTNLVMTGASDVSLGGTGTVTMSNNAQNRIYSDAGQRLTNEASHTIEGAGQIGVNQTLLTNKGLIDANQSQGITIDTTNGVGNTVNTGIMQASNGGKLKLNTSDYTNTGGTIQALDGSLVELSGASITDGILHTAGTGVIR
ncbi:MAG: hypothetical protein GY727_00460, partial [Gammaproteobacteria bacterium]|nr:hypothetical protein [Gammaproteobacteria bacterium]